MKRFHFFLTLIISLSLSLTGVPSIWASLSSASATSYPSASQPSDVDDDDRNLTNEGNGGILQPIQYIDTVGLKPVSRPSTPQKIAYENPNVPTSLQIDKTKAVGEIPILSELSPTGSRTYSVPIEVYHVMRDHLGSITHVITTNSNIAQELSYDAWVRFRGPPRSNRIIPSATLTRTGNSYGP